MLFENDPTASDLPTETIAGFTEIVGKQYALTSQSDIEPFASEQRGNFSSALKLVLKPADAEQVAAIVSFAAKTGTSLIPIGGNTGLVGGGVGGHSGKPEVAVSLSRLNRIRDIDTAGNTMVVEAGVVLESARQAADDVDRLFPLSLGSQGSCQIGGNISTNAGGVGVLAYGNTRELVMGLEVVLADGTLWNGLRRLRKDNTGYDLKNLFIGAEGTLGIITAAVLKLYPKPAGREVAIAGVASPEQALALFETVRAIAGSDVTGFELMERFCVETTCDHFDEIRDPLKQTHAWYVLMEISSGRSADAARALTEEIFEAALDLGLIEDAVLAESIDQQNQFWKLREAMSPAQRSKGGSIKHDISVPVAKIPEFIKRAGIEVEKTAPGARTFCFGHMGDGNLHYNISQPTQMDQNTFMALYGAVNDAVYPVVLALDGSISAEHGIGILKREQLKSVKSPVELDLMKRVKACLDPEDIMNPGKVI